MTELTGTATYCPEDNKLRLYVGRVPRDEYLKLRAEGWTSTPKQDCDFVATWTPGRRDTALEYAEIIEDEDQGAEDRAADRAERFGEYRDKRTSEATGHADTYDQGPTVHGFQSQARAERSARRHDRQGTRAVDAWSKAEYWQRRTAGVIGHALYKSSPGVRMGRIKTLETELRKIRASIEESKKRFRHWKQIEAMPDPDAQTATAEQYSGCGYGWHEYEHPVTGKKGSLWDHCRESNPDRITGAQACTLFFKHHREPADDNEWTLHLQLRIAYENQMLEAQGGRLEQKDVEIGGKLAGALILKVNKSGATGRATSVSILQKKKLQGWTYKGHNIPGTDWSEHQIDLERIAPDAYTEPTPESLAELEEVRATIKGKRVKVDCPLINPTDADAEKLQAIWNAQYANDTPQEPLRITQSQYTANSGTSYRSSLETITLDEKGREWDGRHNGMSYGGSRHTVCKVRKAPGKGTTFRHADRVIIITDKPQKPLPLAKMAALRSGLPTRDNMRVEIPAIQKELQKNWLNDMDKALINDAAYVGWVSVQSMSQISWTPAGSEALRLFREAGPVAALVDASELFKLE